MLDRDGVTVEQAIAAIDWAHGDNFWQAHILSPNKLRAKYETLRRQAAGQRKQPAGANRPNPATGAAAPAPTAEDYLNARPF